MRDALVSVREQEIAEAAAIIQTDSARHVLEIATQRYKAGHTGYLELLDSERTHNEAEISLISIRQARLNATVNLFKALGGGWQPDFVWQDGIFPGPEPVKTGDSADSAKPSDSAKTTETIKTADSADSAKTADFVKPADSAKSVDSAKSADSADLAKSADSEKSANLANPVAKSLLSANAVDSAVNILQNRRTLQ